MFASLRFISRNRAQGEQVETDKTGANMLDLETELGNGTQNFQQMLQNEGCGGIDDCINREMTGKFAGDIAVSSN